MDPSPAGGDTALLLVVALLCSLVAAFVFSGSEASITSLGEPRIRRLLDAHKGPAGWLDLWLTNPAYVLTTLFAGQTLSVAAAAALTASLTLDLFGTRACSSPLCWLALAATVTLCALVLLVCGGIIPKTLARNHPEGFLTLMHAVWWFHLSTRWLTKLLVGLSARLARALGGEMASSSFEVTEEQIEDMVRIGSEAGSIDEDQGDMLQAVFDLSDRPVRSIMTPRTQIDGLPHDATFEMVAAEVRTTNFSRYPIYDRTLDHIVGIFYAKDLILHALNATPETFTLAQHIHEARFVPETKKAVELLKDFQLWSAHMAIVVDEHGGTAGIVTLEDVLEELVGEIYDEYDEQEPPPSQVGPNGWEIDASEEIRNLEDDLKMELPETPSYSTLGGFLIHQLGHVPRQGEALRWQNLLLTVVEADDTRVIRVEVQRMVDEPGQALQVAV